MDDTATLTYTTSGGDYGGAKALSIDRTISVDDDDTADPITSNLPRISLTGGAAVTEGAAASFTVNADPAPTSSLTINLEVSESSNGDFVAENQEGVRTVTLNAGATSTTFTVLTVDDSTEEDDGFVLVLVRDGTGYIADSGHVVNVNDDDDGPTNHRPVLEDGMADQTATAGSAFNYTFSASAFIDRDGDSLTYTAKLLTNNVEGPLPAWLTLNSSTRTFSGTPGSGDTGTLLIRVWADDRNGGTASGTFMLTVSPATNNVPTASFAAATSSAAENAGTRNVRVNLSSAAPSGGLTLTYSVAGTAIAGSGNDFTIQNSGTLGVAAEATSADIPVAVIDDGAEESDETVILTLTGGTGYTVGTTSVHTLTIADNDSTSAQPAASFASGSSSAAENAGTRNVRINLSPAAPSGGLTLSYSVTGTATAGSGNDFTIQNSGTLSIPAEATSADIPVAINDDSTAENAETVILTLAGGAGYTVGTTSVHTLTIADNDSTSAQPSVSFAAGSSSAAENAGTRTVTVNLSSAAPSGGLTLGYSVGGTATAGSGSDFTIQGSGTLSVTAGATSANIPVAINDDNANENAETVILTLAGGTGYTLGSTTIHTLTITDNDNSGVNDDDGVTPGPGSGPVTPDPATPLVSIRPSITIRADSTSVEEGTPAGFTVLASTAPTSALTISLRVNETTGQDFIDTSNEGLQTITLDAGATSVPYPVPTVDDTTEEPDGQVMVTVEPGTGYHVPSTSSSASVTITDNDCHEITFASDSGRVREGGVHTITLHIDPAPTSPLSLRYRLSGTATDGTDYRVQTGTPGVLQIPAGSTRALIRIQSLADEEEDAGETVILHLVGGSGLSLGAVHEHVLTLVDRKEASLEAGRGWLVRFGRTVAEQGLDSIAQRLRAPRSAGTRVSLGGTEMAFTGQDTRQEPGAQAFTPVPLLQHHTDLHTDLHNDVPPSTQQSLSLHEVLQGSHFLSVGEIDAYGGSLAFWGRAAHSSFDGKEDRISLDGDSTAVLLGGDYALGPWLGGITLSHSEGDGDYRESGTPGDIEASLTSLLPWLSLQATERLQVWGALGIGEGDMHLEPEGGEKLRTDIDWTLAGAGVRSALLSSQTGLSLSLVGDVLWMETDAKEINELSVASAGVSRVRLGLEGQYAMALADGAQLIPRLELGVREDEGDAENGAGVELGGGLAWSDPHRGLTLELAGRTLITHDSNDLEDKGLSVSLDYDPIPGSARGLSLALHQEMGTASTGGLEALFASAPLTTPTDHTTGTDTDQELESRLRLEAAYGLVAFEGRFIAGPQAAISHSPAVQDYSLGWRLVPSARHQDLSLQITTLRREQDQEPPEHATTLEMIARW